MSPTEGAERVRDTMDAAEEVNAPDPEPLVAPHQEPRPYPRDALSPTIRAAVTAYQQYGQQPIELVASSALSVAALTTQGLANVGRDSNLVGPISLNLAVIAESGERKTSADRRMKRPAQRWQENFRTDHVAEVAKAESAVAAWRAEREGILAKIKSAAGRKPASGGLSPTELKAALTALEVEKPNSPTMPALFYEDVSPEALAQEMATGWPSAALWSDEGALVVGSRGMSSSDSALRYFGLLNRFWDGNSFERFRTTAPSFNVVGRRLTCSIMMQHIVLRQLLEAAGGVARGTGFLARFLLSWPRSTMGTRDYRECALDGPALSKWDATVTSLLSRPLSTDSKTMALDPPSINLSVRARPRWIDFHDDAEYELGPLQEFADVADFAAKAAENAARIAGVFWVFEHGPCGEIDAETMEAGAAIASWHLHEAKRIMGATKVPQAVSDAALLVQWMQKPAPDGKERWKVSPRDILREGPARLRDKGRRDAAAKMLLATRHIFEVQEPSGTLWVLNPSLRETSLGFGT